MKKILSGLSLAVILLSSCKKDDTDAAPAPVTINADGTLNAADADGALYGIQSKYFDTHNGSTYEEVQFGYAWFGKFPQVSDAGIVKVNNFELDNFGNFYNATAFLSSSDTLFKGTANAWTVQGNSASGIAAFAHTDNTPLPNAPNFTLPASVNINNSLTVNHTSTGGLLGVLYTLTGDNGDTTKYVANTSSSMTFTSSEIKSVAVSGGDISVSIMPVTYSTATHNGKKYYFVKQHQYARGTVAQ